MTNSRMMGAIYSISRAGANTDGSALVVELHSMW